MTELEILKRKVELQKQWLWMLSNISDEDLGLHRTYIIRQATLLILL